MVASVTLDRDYGATFSGSRPRIVDRAAKSSSVNGESRPPIGKCVLSPCRSTSRLLVVVVGYNGPGAWADDVVYDCQEAFEYDLSVGAERRTSGRRRTRSAASRVRVSPWVGPRQITQSSLRNLDCGVSLVAWPDQCPDPPPPPRARSRWCTAVCVVVPTRWRSPTI